MGGKRLILVIGLAFAALAPSSQAEAASVDADCRLLGTASLSPSMKFGPNSGVYTYSNFSFACEGTVDGIPDRFLADAMWAGTYTNAQCLTGTFSSTSAHAWITQSTVLVNQGKSFDFPNDIAVDKGVGTIAFRAASGGGAVYITPTGPVMPSGTDMSRWDCTTSLQVVADFHLTTF
jgi:hypothetical protein